MHFHEIQGETLKKKLDINNIKVIGHINWLTILHRGLTYIISKNPQAVPNLVVNNVLPI